MESDSKSTGSTRCLRHRSHSTCLSKCFVCQTQIQMNHFPTWLPISPHWLLNRYQTYPHKHTHMQTHLCTTYRHWRNASHCVLIKVNPNVYLLWPLSGKNMYEHVCTCAVATAAAINLDVNMYFRIYVHIYKGAQKYEWVHWMAWKVTLTIFNWKIFIIYQFVCKTNNNNHNQKNKI